MQLSPSFFAHQTEALQFWSCPTSVLIFRDPTPPKSAGEPVQQAQAHPTSLKFRTPGAKVQHHPADLGFSPFFSTNAHGDAATDWRYIALTSGTHRPHSTQQASAMRPEASSTKRRPLHLTNLISGDLALLKSRAHKKETRHWHVNQ